MSEPSPFINGILSGIISGNNEIYNPVFLYGASAELTNFCSTIVSRYPRERNSRIIWTTTPDWVDGIIKALIKRNIRQFEDSFYPCDLFILLH